ncbi:MAG: BlaI/MecI/CopY family transcriptional regulator [Bacteroidales bacterium]|nr:BlaI/MecI/CopY family transcriptional regulator [Bacteroidales bacterium]
MKNISSNRPTDSEMEILEVLWENGPSSVRFINNEINKKRPCGYTTTLKLMQIMLKKQLLTREDKTKVHIYAPLADRDATEGLLLENFLTKSFSGSAHRLVMQALGNHNTTDAELEEIKKLIDELERKQYGNDE